MEDRTDVNIIDLFSHVILGVDLSSYNGSNTQLFYSSTCQHCILPNLTFTVNNCAVIKWTFIASWNSDNTSIISYPHIELWRRVSGTNYTLLQTTAGLVPVHSGLPNIYEYRLGTPWSFKEGDTFGVQLPPPDVPQLTLIFSSYNISLTYCLFDNFTQCSKQKLLPLVTPEIAGECTQISL